MRPAAGLAMQGCVVYIYTPQHNNQQNLHEHAGSIDSPHLLTLFVAHAGSRQEEEERGQQQL